METRVSTEGCENNMTEEQYKFKQKIKCDLNYDVDFNTYHITRGRGWSKADGSCGACIDATFTDSKGVVDKVTLLLCHPLRKYNGKKYKLIEIEDVRTGSIFIEIEEGRTRKLSRMNVWEMGRELR